MNAAAQQFIERIGILWENEGLPRTAGRIFGFLFLQPEPCSLPRRDKVGGCLRCPYTPSISRTTS